jgi:hypothetical protein
LDAKVDVEVNSLYVKRINIEDLMGYICIIKVDTGLFVMITKALVEEREKDR